MLVTLAPVMIALALSFGSWEIFLLVLLGVSISGTLTGREEPLKGWASGWLGLMIAMVGMDRIHGVDRFSFNVPELLGGIKYLPVLIGLFGLTETINVLSRRTPVPIATKVGRVLPPLSFFGKYWKSALRSSAVGTVTALFQALAQISRLSCPTISANGDREEVLRRRHRRRCLLRSRQ